MRISWRRTPSFSTRTPSSSRTTSPGPRSTDSRRTSGRTLRAHRSSSSAPQDSLPSFTCSVMSILVRVSPPSLGRVNETEDGNNAQLSRATRRKRSHYAWTNRGLHLWRSLCRSTLVRSTRRTTDTSRSCTSWYKRQKSGRDRWVHLSSYFAHTIAYWLLLAFCSTVASTRRHTQRRKSLKQGSKR